jgi:accessory gene regulator protein AgrB
MSIIPYINANIVQNFKDNDSSCCPQESKIICKILYILFARSTTKLNDIMELADEAVERNNTLIFIFCLLIFIIRLNIPDFFLILAIHFDCEWLYPNV